MISHHSHLLSAVRAALLVGLAVAAIGCAGAGPDSTSSSSGLAAIQQQIFNQSCISGGCHNLSGAGGLVLLEGQSFGQLVGVSAVNSAAHQAGLSRVTPFQADVSFLLIKVTNPAQGEGDRMPASAAPLSAEQIAMIRQWIVDGAPEFEGITPTLTATPTPTESATVTGTSTQTVPPTRTPTTTVTPTGTLLPSPTATPSPSASATPTSTATPTVNQDATLANIQTQIFSTTCIDQFCHDAQTHSNNLSLVTGASYDALVGVLSVNPAAQQAGLLRVKPGDPDNSFLIIKVTDPSVPQGLRMPSGKPPLSAAQIQLVRDWITQGAQP